MGVTYFLLLSSLGLVTVQAQDCSRPVPGLNMNLKDTYINQQTFTDGTKVYFNCDVGYMSAGGSTAITCSAGSWSPVTLKCERKNCGSVGEVTNGHVDYPEGIQFGDKAVITCDTGYRLVGKREITCGDRGWMGRLPECEVVKCSPPPVVENGVFSPNHEDPYSYGDVVLYSCDKDYSLSGSKSRTCSEDGTFRPDPPTCIKVECEDPHVVNGYWFEGSRPPYRLSSTVTFKCDSGYIMKGEGTQTCDISSKWSPGLPTCERSLVPPITTATTTTTTDSTPKDGGTSQHWTWVGALVGVLVIIAVCLTGFFIFKKRQRKSNSPIGPTLLSVR